MQSESAQLAALRAKVEEYLGSAFGPSFEVDRDGDFVLKFGSAGVFVMCRDWHGGRTIVKLMAPVARNCRVTSELGLYLAKKNSELLFGAFALYEEEGVVTYEHALLGDHLNPDELQLAVTLIATTADDYDDEVVRLSGGRRFEDWSGPPAE